MGLSSEETCIGLSCRLELLVGGTLGGKKRIFWYSFGE